MGLITSFCRHIWHVCGISMLSCSALLYWVNCALTRQDSAQDQKAVQLRKSGWKPRPIYPAPMQPRPHSSDQRWLLPRPDKGSHLSANTALPSSPSSKVWSCKALCSGCTSSLIMHPASSQVRPFINSRRTSCISQRPRTVQTRVGKAFSRFRLSLDDAADLRQVICRWLDSSKQVILPARAESITNMQVTVTFQKRRGRNKWRPALRWVTG